MSPLPVRRQAQSSQHSGGRQCCNMRSPGVRASAPARQIPAQTLRQPAGPSHGLEAARDDCPKRSTAGKVPARFAPYAARADVSVATPRVVLTLDRRQIRLVLGHPKWCQIEQVPGHDRGVAVIVPPAHTFDLK